MGFENYPLADQLDGLSSEGSAGPGDPGAAGLRVSDAEVAVQSSFNLSVVVYPGEILSIKLEYNANVYEDEVLKQVAQHMTELLRRISADPEVPITQLTAAMDRKLENIIQSGQSALADTDYFEQDDGDFDF